MGSPATLERTSELAVGTTEMWHPLAMQVDPFSLVCAHANLRMQTQDSKPHSIPQLAATGGSPSRQSFGWTLFLNMYMQYHYYYYYDDDYCFLLLLKRRLLLVSTVTTYWNHSQLPETPPYPILSSPSAPPRQPGRPGIGLAHSQGGSRR